MNKQNMALLESMPQMKLFSSDSPEYAAAFQTLLRSTNERIYIKQMLTQLISGFSQDAIAVDWGAGTGTLTRELLQQFSTVYAVEPHPELQNVLAQNCPAATVIPSGILEAHLPALVDVGIMSHLLYYLPDETWGETCLKAASLLTQQGILVVILKHFTAGENQMFEAFGAAQCDLSCVFNTFKRYPKYEVNFVSTPGRFQTKTFEETLEIARLMLGDRPRDSYHHLPTETEFQAYVRQHFWDDTTQQGGWDCPQQFLIIRRNPFYA
ncbi:class I SAM-dependent methyltransferase [Phormidesmis sp. 146-35]